MDEEFAIISLSVMLLIPVAGCGAYSPSGPSATGDSTTPTESDLPDLRVLSSFSGNVTVEIRYFSNNTTYISEETNGASSNTYDELPNEPYWVDVSVADSERTFRLEPYHETTVEVTDAGEIRIETTEYD